MKDRKRLKWRIERKAPEVAAILRVAAASVHSGATGANTQTDTSRRLLRLRHGQSGENIVQPQAQTNIAPGRCLITLYTVNPV